MSSSPSSRAISARKRNRIVEILSHAIVVRVEGRVFDKFGAGMIAEERERFASMLELGDKQASEELELLECDDEELSQARSAIEGEFHDATEEAVCGIETAKRKREDERAREGVHAEAWSGETRGSRDAMKDDEGGEEGERASKTRGKSRR